MLNEARKEHPDDNFEGVMRHTVVNKETGQAVLRPQIQTKPDGTLVDGLVAQYAPRIRCKDCPGKAYTVGPGMTLDNFKVHLRNQQHTNAVNKRLGRTSS